MARSLVEVAGAQDLLPQRILPLARRKGHVHTILILVSSSQDAGGCPLGWAFRRQKGGRLSLPCRGLPQCPMCQGPLG